MPTFRLGKCKKGGFLQGGGATFWQAKNGGFWGSGGRRAGRVVTREFSLDASLIEFVTLQDRGKYKKTFFYICILIVN
jgi:hypothetical protein